MGFLTNGFGIELTPESLARLMAVANCGPVFTAQYTAAINYAVNRVATRARQNTTQRFAHPTGHLMGGIRGIVHNPFLGEVGVGKEIPYARRREFGFSGEDSLGRVYNDPGAFYLRDALNASRPDIRAAYYTATQAALHTILI